jgi:anti-anti-sigma factor
MPEDAEPSQTQLLRIEAQHDSAASKIILDGELDIHTIERFLASIQAALEIHPRSIATDASAVGFMDSSGLAGLLQARSAANAAGVPFRVSDVSPRVRHRIEVAGLERLLGVD